MFNSISNTQLMIMFLGSKKLIRTHSKNTLARWMADLSTELSNRNFTDFKGWHDFSQWENYHQFTMEPYRASASFSRN